MKKVARTQEIQHSTRVRRAGRDQRTSEGPVRPATRRHHYYELVPAGAAVIRDEGWKSFFRKARGHLIQNTPGLNELRYTLRCVRAICRSPRESWRDGTIKVLYSPHGSDNPELDMIINSLEKDDVSVFVAKTCNLFSLIKSIEEQGKPHVIHLHWARFFTSGNSRITTMVRSASFLLELSVLKLCGIRIVWTIHNIVDHESAYPRWELFINRLIARLSNELIVHTNSTKLEVRSKYRLRDSKPISVVYPVNYAPYYENSISQSEARRMLTLNPKDFVFLYFGRVRAYKGVRELIDCFGQLEGNSETNRVKLLIVGQPFTEKIHEDVLNRCALNKNIMPVLRWVDDREIQIYMNAADVAVFPFENILNSGSVALAMAFSKPVVAPAMGSIPEILDSKGGFTYAASEANGLLRAVEQALKCKPNELKAMGDGNYERIKEFTPEALAAKTREVYRRCIGAQK